VIIHTVDIMCN